MRQRSKFRTILIPLLLVVITVMAMLLLQLTSIERSKTEVQESLRYAANAQSSTVAAIIEGQFTTLHTFADGLILINKDNMQDALMRLSAVWPEDADIGAAIVMSDGTAYYPDGSKINVSDRKYFERSMAGEDAVENIQSGRKSSELRIVVSVPIETNHGITGVLYASLSERYFKDRFAEDQYMGKRSVLVCDSNGVVVISVESGSSGLKRGDNVFSALSQYAIHGSGSIDSLRGDLKSGRGGVLSFSKADVERYMAYEPLGVNDWSIYNIVPGTFVHEEVAKATMGGNIAVTIVMICALLLIWFTMRSDMKSVKEIESKKRAAEKSEKRLRAHLEQSPDVSFEYDFAAREMQFYGKDVEDGGLSRLLPELEEKVGFDEFRKCVFEADAKKLDELFNSAEQNSEPVQRDVRILDKSGEHRWCRIVLSPLNLADGESLLCVGRISDVSEEKSEFEKLRKEAQTDLLTGLYNHDTGLELMREYVEKTGRHDRHTLFMIDIDNFKTVNDGFGHSEGDRILKIVAGEISAAFRHTDIIARVGGDEFVVLMKNTPTREFARMKGAELCETLQFMHIGGIDANMTSSIGVAVYEGDGMSFDVLYKESDMAMYLAKKQGKSRFVLMENENDAESAGTKTNPRADAEAKFNAVQLSALMEYMESGVLLIEIQERRMNTLYVSPSFYRTNKCTPEQISSLSSILDVIYTEDVDKVASEIRLSALSSTVYDATFRAYSADKKLGWRHVRGVRIPYDNSRFPVMLLVITDVTDMKEQERALFEDREKLSLALDQTDISMWTFDFEMNILTNMKYGTYLCDLPESAIKNGVVHPDSRDDYRRFYKNAFAGRETDSCVVKLQMRSSSYKWYKLSFRTIYDESGQPANAIGISVPLPNIEAEKIIFDQEERMLSEIAASLMFAAKVNLSRDLVEMYSSDPNSEYGHRHSSFGGLIKEIGEHCASAEDMTRIMQRMGVEQLSLAFERGSSLLFVDYRQKNSDGRIRWVSLTVSLLKEPISGDLYAFIYTRDIDQRKRWEIAAHTHVSRDNITFLYTKETAEAIMRTVMGRENPYGRCASIAMLELGELDRLDEEIGTGAVRNILTVLARLFTSLVPHDMVVSRYGRNRFAFFYVGDASPADIIKAAKMLGERISAVRILASLSSPLDFYIGVSLSKTDEITFGELLERALVACDAGMEDKRRMTIYEQSLPHVDSEAEKGANARSKELPSEEISEERLPARDTLTGLLSRQSYNRFVMEADAETLISLGAMFIDINGLSKLNHEYGNEYGDNVLIYAAQMLTAEFGEEELFRLSGDEFLCLARDLTHDEFIKRCGSVTEALEFAYPGLFCVGSTWADRGIDIQALADSAESIMELGKQEYYLDSETVDKRHKAEMLKTLQKSIMDDSFKVYLQPKADAVTGEIVGAEALVRLVDTERGIIKTGKFIPMYEKERIIRFLDFHILEKTLAIMQKWHAGGKRMIPVSVNFSRSTLLAAEAFETVVGICEKYSVPYEYIELEITESVGATERATTKMVCERFRSAGFKLSLDDFGSQYSSLYILSAVQFDVVKIDKSIIDDIVTSALSRIMVENVLRICEETHAACVAEGVETKEQLDVVRELGCGMIQGYIIDRPLPCSDFESMYIKEQ